MAASGFVEVGSFQQAKHSERAAGDTLFTRRSDDDRRTICVLSDGLGSGVKAGVLSTLTATMALRLMERNLPIEQAARAIMETLPVCSTRQISYSTFTIVDITSDGRARIIEYDNPRLVFARGGELRELDRRAVRITRPEGSEGCLYYSETDVNLEDRLIVMSDGVTQSGMGSPGYPLGWREAGVRKLVSEKLAADPQVSATQLARTLVNSAVQRDGTIARDDISSLVIYYRSPRRLLVATGPPYDNESDYRLAAAVREFPGRRVVAGGTTGNIVARELGTTPVIEMGMLDEKIPPYARMEGDDLLTEGMVTLARVSELLDEHPEDAHAPRRENAATLFVQHMMESDSIDILVGTRVNQAHQDPRVPAQFELRRTITQQIATTLREKYLKKVSVSYL